MTSSHEINQSISKKFLIFWASTLLERITLMIDGLILQ